MTIGSLAGCLLVALASIAVIEITADASTDRAAQRHQWRGRAQSPVTLRVTPCSTPAMTGEVGPPVSTPLGSPAPPDQTAALPLLSVSVFVPPRV